MLLPAGGEKPNERSRYSLKTVAMAPMAEARISTSCDQPNRNPAIGPHPSRTNTYHPPVRGNVAASSATVRAPHNEITPSGPHTSIIIGGSGTRDATTAGVRKIPEPMVMPMTSPVADQNPIRRARLTSARGDDVELIGHSRMPSRGRLQAACLADRGGRL